MHVDAHVLDVGQFGHPQSLLCVPVYLALTYLVFCLLLFTESWLSMVVPRKIEALKSCIQANILKS